MNGSFKKDYEPYQTMGPLCGIFDQRDVDFVHTFLKRKLEIDHDENPELTVWLDRFAADKKEAAKDFWYEVLKGIQESLCETF